MSLSQNNNSQRRVKSIRRQLASAIVGGKIGVCFWNDILLTILISIVWLAAFEHATTGNIDFTSRQRCIEDVSDVNNQKMEIKSAEDAVKDTKSFRKAISERDGLLEYRITDTTTGKVIASTGIFEEMINLDIVILGLFIVQIIWHNLGLPFANHRVKRILRPLDELALRADEIARFDFSEDKYHLIEEKISLIEPDDEEKISLGDKDLLGIETAMNNLISRIRESNKQQARFVNDASHELRTPIAVIQGYANMLSRWGREDEKVLDESITAIQHESDNMKRLVEQLLFLARGDAGRTVINKERISLNSILQEVYEESLMIDEDHVYRIKNQEEPVYVMADEGLIKQALRILVDNAAKYTNKKDEIFLSVGRSESEAFIQVQDTGIGMKEADVEHMFERFYRADEARSFNGTGLGLSIAKWIVDKHQGHFEIVSREELGTRIGIYLEVAE